MDIEKNGTVVEYDKCLRKSNDGRLFPDHLLYCEGAHRPKFRGILHFISALLIPIAYWEILQVSNCNISVIASTLYMLTNLFCYGLSGLFHVGRWSPKAEIFIQKLDHCGIALLSTGTVIPVSLVLLPYPFGALLLGSTAIACFWTIYNIFILRPSVINQVLTAGILLLFFPKLFFIFTTFEFTIGVIGIIAQIIGLVIFLNRKPSLYPDTFGFHELFHCFVVLSGVCVYLCNRSVIQRYVQ